MGSVQSVTVPGSNNGQSPEGHDQAMIDKFEGQQQQGQQSESNPVTDNRPGWLPEKFKTVEDMAKAYGELEKKISGAGKQPAEEQAVAPAPDPTSVNAEQAANQLKSNGLDFNSLSAEYARDGELSKQSYTDLEAKGYPKDLVDAWIEGQKAVVANTQQRVFNEVGGEQRYREMVGWAAANLSTTEIDAYNAATEQGEASAKWAAAGLMAKYEAANGKEGKLIQGFASSGSAGFASRQQLVDAMNDPRYQRDPAFRREVADKLAVSDKLF